MQHGTNLHMDIMVSCCSGGDGCDVEQAGQSVPCSCVDHYPGCSSWTSITLPAHISTVQGNKLINNPTNTFTTESNKSNIRTPQELQLVCVSITLKLFTTIKCVSIFLWGEI